MRHIPLHGSWLLVIAIDSVDWCTRVAKVVPNAAVPYCISVQVSAVWHPAILWTITYAVRPCCSGWHITVSYVMRDQLSLLETATRSDALFRRATNPCKDFDSELQDYRQLLNQTLPYTIDEPVTHILSHTYTHAITKCSPRIATRTNQQTHHATTCIPSSQGCMMSCSSPTELRMLQTNATLRATLTPHRC